MSKTFLKRLEFVSSLVMAVVVAGLMSVAFWSTASAQTPLDVTGYRDFPFEGWDGPGNPTGEKPQSKLWWHDGFWWSGSYVTAAGEFRIHRLNWGTQTWVDTGVSIDERETAKADVITDGNTLYILSHHAVVSDGKRTSNATNFARLYRYTYDPVTQTYSLDTGFPTTVNEHEAEAMVLALDSAGYLWAAWVSRGDTVDPDRSYRVFLTYSSNGGTTWVTPFVPTLSNPPAAADVTEVERGDLVSIVAFGDEVGIMWNRGFNTSLNFAWRDAGGQNPWEYSDVTNSIPVPAGADDHISLQARSDGTIVAAIKTNAKTSDPILTPEPLIGLVVRRTDGQFRFHEYSANTDKDTRPIVVLDEDADEVYVFVTGKETGSKICYKSMAMSDAVNSTTSFAGPGDCGFSFIEDGTYRFINDATSLRSNVGQYTGIAVMASDTTSTTVPVGTYVHNVRGEPAPVVTARTPGVGQIGVALDASITVTFSKAMNGGTLNTANFSVVDGATPVPGTVTSNGTRSAIFTPDAPLKANTVYTVRLNNNILDTSGIRLNEFEATTADTVVEEWQFTTTGGTVQFAAASYVASEVSGSATISVTLTPASSQPVSVTYATSDGTATAPGDYTATTGTLVFAPNEVVKTFSVPIIDDGDIEGDEDVNLALSSPGGATLGAQATAKLNIVDDETLTVGFNPAAYTVVEDAGQALLNVSLSASYTETVTVQWATSNGTATAGEDYTAASNTLTFNPGDTSKSIPIPITDDTLDEVNETFTVTLSTPTIAALGLAFNAVVTIEDNDARPSVRFSQAAYEVAEGAGNATIAVELSAASSLPISVTYATANGTAAAGNDYTATSGTLTFNPGETSKNFTVAILNDALDEANETVNLALSAPSNATAGTPFGAVLTITDDDAPPAVQFATAAVTKGEPSGTVEIEVVLNAPSGRSVSVDYATTGGTATSGSDYGALQGTLTFAPGQTSGLIELAILDDSTDEPDETVVLTLSNPANATLGGQSGFTLTIDDNDSQPSIQFSAATYVVAEGAGSAKINVVLSAASTEEITVQYATSDDSAAAGADYTAANGTLTFAPGETNKSFSVSILNDTLDEGEESINLTLSDPTNANLGATSTAQVTIIDDEGPVTVRFSTAAFSVNESQGNATITVLLNRASGSQVTVKYATSDGTAVAGDDYTAANGTLTFAPGETSKSFMVAVTDDLTIEQNKTVNLALSDPSNATLGANSSAVMTIVDDDTPGAGEDNTAYLPVVLRD